MMFPYPSAEGLHVGNMIGGMFDWRHELSTTDPRYYKWTQWVFLQLLKAGKAYKKRAAVNWCPKDKTVLANEQVIDGRCERCGAVFERGLRFFEAALRRRSDRSRRRPKRIRAVAR